MALAGEWCSAAWLLASLDCLFSGLSLNLHCCCCCSSLHSTLRDTPPSRPQRPLPLPGVAAACTPIVPPSLRAGQLSAVFLPSALPPSLPLLCRASMRQELQVSCPLS